MDIKASLQNQISTATADTGHDPSPKTENQGEKFGDVWNKIQSQYGAKAEKPKEIKKTLGKDDFLRLMVVQMKNQDPTKPFNAEQMAGQMAQYASVEQLQNINRNLGKLENAGQPMERLAMTNMIGKTVTVDRERFPHTEGQNDSLSFNLSKDAASCKIKVLADNGDTLYEKDMGTLKSGSNTATWNGLKTNTLPAKTGNYTFRVEALDQNGAAIPTNPNTQGKVIGVSFAGAEPVFLVGNPAHPDKITIQSIIKVDSEEASNQIPGAIPLAGAAGAPNGGVLPGLGAAATGHGQAPSESENEVSVASPLYVPGGRGQPAAAAPPANFFAFQRGKGSSDLDAEAARALAAFQSQNQAPGRSAPPAGSIISGFPGRGGGAAAPEKGFPNGISSARQEELTGQSGATHTTDLAGNLTGTLSRGGENSK